MDVHPSTPEEMVCLQCGDVGLSNAFVFCVKCLQFAVHRYCLDVIPETIDEFVPWLCDDCETEKKNRLPVLKKDAIQHKTRDCTTSEHILGNSGTGMKKNGIVPLTVEHPAPQSYVSCAKIKLLECSESDSDCQMVGLEMKDEAIVLSAADERKGCEQSISQLHGEEKVEEMVGLGMKDEDIILSAADERKRCEQSTQLHGEEKLEDHLILNKLSADTSQRDSAKENTSASAVSIMRKDHYTLCNNSSDMPCEESTNIGFNVCAASASDSTVSKDVKVIKVPLKKDHDLHHRPDAESIAALPPLSSYSGSVGSSKKMKSDIPNLKKQKVLDLGAPCADMTTETRGSNLSRESEVTRERTPVSNHNSYSCNGFPEDSTISPMADCSMCAEPVMDSIWRGSFNIFNNEADILEDVMAHLSISACQRVYDEACRFKPVLELEMLPRSHVWPQSSQKCELIPGNIALYFFPSERSERFYDGLVSEMVEEELSLKAIVNNAELLVFPSTKLPLSYWRFQGKYYLWGVFREKQHSASCSPSCGTESRYNPVMRRETM